MSDSSHPLQERAARRERLRLLCAADRSRVRLVWRMPSRPAHRPGSLSASLLSAPALSALLPMVPGPIGRWSRRLGAGAGVLRAVLGAV